MATKIRLKRIGRRNRPFYRLVVMDSRKRRDGAAIEELGWYNPIDADHSYDIKDDRIIHWLAEGAIPTNAAHKLLRRSGIAHQWHLMQQGLDEAAVEKEMKKWALNREEVLQARTERVKAKTAEKAKPEEVEESSDGSLEVGKADVLYRNAKHPYTKALITAIPTPDPEIKKTKTVLEGDVPSPINPPKGCAFHPRCPIAEDICRKDLPSLINLDEEHSIACHLVANNGKNHTT